MAVPAEMKAGSCSFHNGLIAHGAGANMTPGWRRAMTCGFMPDGCTFNGKQNILTDEQFASYQIGDVLGRRPARTLSSTVSPSPMRRNWPNDSLNNSRQRR